MIFPQEYKFAYNSDWSFAEYEPQEAFMITTVLSRICRLFHDAVEGIGLGTDDAFNGMTIETTSNKNHPVLFQYKALGLSLFTIPNKNLNYVPSPLERILIAPFTGIMSMEIAHSIFWTLTRDGKKANDIVHWLYNENHLYFDDYASDNNFRNFGGSLRIVLPDIVYGWRNQDKIMSDIRSGIAKPGPNLYWSTQTSAAPDAVAATEHELTHIKNFLVFGDTRIHM